MAVLLKTLHDSQGKTTARGHGTPRSAVVDSEIHCRRSGLHGTDPLADHVLFVHVMLKLFYLEV